MPIRASTAARILRFRSVGMRQCYEAHVNASERPPLSIRRAVPADAERVAEIFNQGVEDRLATFETRPAEPGDAARWIDSDLVIVGERDGVLVGWAKASPYADNHPYYDGVREATLYVERGARRT